MENTTIDVQTMPALPKRPSAEFVVPENKTDDADQDLQIALKPEPASSKAFHQIEQPVIIKPKVPVDDRSLLHKLLVEPNHRNIFISSINAMLHFVATITSFDKSTAGSLMTSVNKVSNNAAFLFTRWIAPIVSYGYAAVEAIRNKKPIEAILKLVPPSFLPFVGDANIDTVYGSSTGFNQPYDMVLDRIEEKSESSASYAKYAQQANSTNTGNIKLTWEVFQELVKEFVQGKMDPKKGIFFINCPMILAGALPIMLFARKSRDTLLVRALGLIRNAGGILGDIGWIWGEPHNPYKLTGGILCMIGACADVVKRWVSDDTSRVLIHLGSALNVSAYALWNAFNGKKNIKTPVQTSVLQAA
ncbi:MAG: hypothetical protein O3C63_00735 [Cyanobacteria bacterium]|nr:hypothetical protein [Cyanobacteriota bacterium]MDA1020241.1 hypothetical protein [Cyanobacteriota bacterium]